MTVTFATDTDYLAAVLADGEWHQLERIIGQSQRERGHGFTVHSRAADLRKRGYVVEQRSERNGRRVKSYYRLGSLEEPSSIPHGTIAHTPSGSMGVRGGEGSSSGTADHGMPPTLPSSSGAVSLTVFDEQAAA